MLPTAASPWLDAFRGQPGWFAAGAVFIAACLYASSRIGASITNAMRTTWATVIAGAVLPTAPHPGVLSSIVASAPYRKAVLVLRRRVLPALWALGIYAGAIVLLSRLEVGVVSTGLLPGTKICSEQTAGQSMFDTRDLCAAMPYTLQQGRSYAITLTATVWDDGGQPATVEGVMRPSWRMLFAVPFRRHLSEPWFKPIARIGASGNDIYPLEPAEPFAPGAPRDELTSCIRARRNGRLFVYVNDAVILWPWLHGYHNNQGRGTVTNLPAPGCPK